MSWDVVVVGAGHAGCEASLACARMGVRTLVVTLMKDRIGHMACNPSIGGTAKSQVVREVDALGGEMARAIDETAIQYRKLNTRKGPAVQATRAQADRGAYERRMRTALELQEGLEVIEAEVKGINKAVSGLFEVLISSDKGEDMVVAKAVVVTTGTFLRGLCHAGDESWPEGRHGEPPANTLSESLKRLGLSLGRLKTGTPARLKGDTIDYSILQEEPGQLDCRPFSLDTKEITKEQVSCYITHTNQGIHQLINANMHRSPLYSGKIEGIGPRYCPSIEDKVVKFPGRERHQVFLEPEDRSYSVVYPSGISSSLPLDVQDEMIHRIKGLEHVEIIRYGYAVEYDFVYPVQLHPTLEVKEVGGLFLAGQINGTSGYEEAAGQGILAGINAALYVRSSEPFVLKRSDAYIGTMVDDLVTKGTNEPYRLFTSRAEYRLLLREDNADRRLRHKGYELGLVTKEQMEETGKKVELIENVIKDLKDTKVSLGEIDSDVSVALGIERSKRTVSLHDLLKMPGVTLDTLSVLYPKLRGLDHFVREEVEIEVKYEGYISRQIREVEKMESLEKVKLPARMNYKAVKGLSREVAEKLSHVRPTTLGQASRIPGVTPAALARLAAEIKTGRGK